ncbi:MAG: hypothetical protein LAT81_00965 [Oceanicaulis sp.]|nr:hypothetical protein [Oceanicaulis sp.]
MMLPLLAPLRDLIAGHAGKAAEQAATTTATFLLGGVAAGFLTAAGVVSLATIIGFPLAALVFAALFAVLALGVHLYARRRAARRAAQIASAEGRAIADAATASALVKLAVPLLSLAGGIAAIVMARRS